MRDHRTTREHCLIDGLGNDNEPSIGRLLEDGLFDTWHMPQYSMEISVTN